MPARKRVGKAVPAAAIAATLAAGAVAYGVTGGSHPNPAKLTQALSAPVRMNALTHAGAGKPQAGASVLLTPRAADSAAAGRSRAQVTPAGRPSAQPAPAATAQPSAAAKPAIATRPAARPAARPSHPPAATPSPSAAPTHSAAAATTVSCSDTSLLPENVTAIVSFLRASGYSGNAAAGIAGNIYQESKGDPESIGMGGGGLIGWTPLPSGFVTGNPSADLQTQLSALLTYNNGWSSYLPALNSAASPAAAADIYVTDFERAGIPAASTREASAEAVASACGL
jgi:tail lysozyme